MKKASNVFKTIRSFKDKEKKPMQENASEDPKEYDYEGDMVKSDLRSVMANAQRIIDMVKDEDNLPEWCQNKVTLAEDYISTVANYMTAEMNEEVEYLEEKNVPTNPSLWSRAKSLAKQKFDVYPSAYANGWAAKWYKSKGGSWRSVNEAYNTMSPSSYDDQPMVAFRKKENEKKKENPPFEPDKPKKTSAIAGKYGIGYSTARHLARTAMKKQIKPSAGSLKESRKADIVKEIVKKKKDENGKAKDKFEANPTLTSEIVKEDK